MTLGRRRAAVLAALLGTLSAAPAALAVAPQSVLDAIGRRSAGAELNYQVNLDTDCFLDPEQVAEAIEEIVARSLITPLQRLAPAGEVTLIVTADCTLPTTSTGLGAFSLEVAYLALVDGAMWKLDWEYGSLGIGGSEFILAEIEKQVEDALLDFIRAHS